MDFVVTAEPTSETDERSRCKDSIAASNRPTLGEILDMIAAERPEWRVTCDPELRERRVGQVRIAG